MDPVNNWKKILLQWIKECNFLEKNFYSIDQTEIESFFMHFKQRFKGNNISKYNDLSSFLKEQYPLFEPLYDDENILSSSDHIYVYSLLLHFSCVRCVEPFFQENCQKLNELAQRNITAFFQNLLTDECLTKEALRHVIASIEVFTPPNNRFVFNTDSPMKTPRKCTDISPPTPRSCMLQEKNKKVYTLQAQLETLEYEKSVLETDLKSYKDKIDRLNQDLKKSNQEVQDLKNNMSKSMESGECRIRNTGEEQIRKLNKKIAQKEQEIAKQREAIEDLTEQKDSLNEKLKNAEKQMKLLRNSMSELAEKVDDLSQELEKKEEKIQDLSESKIELEQFISEMRSSTANSRPDLNMSSEFLDLSRATNSSGSIHSPENLGSVVDIKLREKENENERLLKEISSIRIDNEKLSKAMGDLTARYSKLFDICNENLIIDDDNKNTTDLSNYFIIFSNYMEMFAKKYEQNCLALNMLKADLQQIEEQNLSQAKKLDEIQNKSDEQIKEIDELLTANKLLQTSKTSLEHAIKELEHKFEKSLKERSEEANNLKNLQKEIKSLKTEKLESEKIIQQQIESLRSKENFLTNLQSDNENKVQLINENQQKLKELYQEKHCFEKQIFEMKNVEKNLLEQLDNEKFQRSELEKKSTYLSCELEKSKQNYDAVLNEKKYLTEEKGQEIFMLKQTIQTLSDEKNLKVFTISELQADKESLIDSMQEKVQSLSVVINKYEDKFEGVRNQLTESTKKLLHTEAELNSSQNELQKVSSQFDRTNEVFRKVTTFVLHVVTDLNCQLGLEINKASIESSIVSCDIDDIEPPDNKLKEEIELLIDEITSLKYACEHFVCENASLQKKFSELEKTTENLNEEKSWLEKSVNNFEAERLKQVELETNLKDQLRTMTSSVEKLKTEISNKTNDAEMLLKKQNDLVKELQEEVFRLTTDTKLANEKAEKRIQVLETANAQLDIEIAEKNNIREKLEKTTKNINQLQSKITLLETELRRSREEASKTSNELSRELEETKVQLKNEVSTKQQIKEELEGVKHQLNDKVEDLTRELENSKIKVNMELMEKNKIIEELDKTTENINQLQSKISFLEPELKRFKEEASKNSDEFDQEACLKQQMSKEIESLKLQFDNVAKDNVKLSENLKNIKLQLETEQFEKLQIEKLQSEAAQKYQEQIENITLQLETETTKTKKLLDNLENTKFLLENEVKNKQQLEIELEETKSRLENEITKFKIDLEKARLELDKQILQKPKLLEEFEETKFRLENEVTTYKMELEKTLLALDAEILEKSKISKDFESTKLQLESEVTEKIQIEKSLKEANQRLKQILPENQQIKEELVKMKLQMTGNVAEFSDVKEELKLTKIELNKFRLEITELVNKYETQIKFQLENEALAKTELEERLEKANNELSDLQAKIVDLEAKNKLLNQKSEDYSRQLEEVKLQLKNEVNEKCKVTEALEDVNKQKNEVTNEKILLENKYQILMIEAEKYSRDVQKLQNEETRLFGEIEILKNTSEAHIQKLNKETEEQKDNVSRLIQEIASIRKEKEFAEEEKKILTKRLESYQNEQTSKDTNQKSIQEKLQVAEKEILIKLNQLKNEQLKSQDLDNQVKKLQLENAKIRETAAINMKRVEKQALTLGDYQAQCQKLKKETDVAQNNAEMLKSSSEMIKRENSRLNQEYKSLKEKLSKCEKLKDQLESKIQTLQKEIEELTEEKKNLEVSENDLKTSNSSLEKIKHNLEDKIRKLAKSLSDLNVALSKLEQDKVQLNLEVGGLNKQLQENKAILSMKLQEIENLTSNLIDAKNTNSQLVELNEKHENQAREIEEENSRLNDQLSKLSLRLQIAQEEHETTKTELVHLKSAIEVSKLERDAIERDHRTAVERLMGIEGLVEERRSTEVELSNKIKSLESEILKLSTQNYNLEELRNKDKLMIEQLNEDISIFEAKLKKSRGICEENDKKWAEEKELLSAEVKESENRIKETRLELEGKLEKMKNKMKTLYNDEVTKMKKKQEREVAVFKTDIDSLKAKNEKHEAHIKKLSSQIFRLNENLLEYQKENTFLKTKIQDLENKPRQLSRARPSSAHQVLGSNLHMEDEEGEIFNNTYLSDLKDGRISEYFNTDICAQELQYRNSLLPPHLKSTYLAQFDHQMGEDEIRDTPTLDDSSSTLLNTGQRKKVSGATSYKRPGPPTPSKNAGRLSFGGIGELNRELLKESHDIASCSSTSSKTPAKFKFFSSKLSMRGDERKSFVMNFKKKLLNGGTIQCSSTPRKSKAHIDQRRLLDQIMSTASPGGEFSPDCIVKPAVNLPSSLKNLELNRRVSLYKKWRQPRLSYASDSGNSDVNSPQMKDLRYGSSGSKKRIKRSKDRRGSIYLRGSMFARNCRTPTMRGREVFKNKSKVQRNANFNKYRQEVLNEMLVKKSSLCPNDWDETCNNNNDDFFLKEIDVKKHGINGDGSSFEDSDEEDVNNGKTSKHFQQLLEAKESTAPFEISEINSNPSCLNVNNSSSNVHSRTIYGASVILNRKIPNVSTTMVRKSSIYVKGSGGKSVILVTNQTITLKDLAYMWLQMNVSAKTVIALCFTATLVGIISFVIQFMDR